MRAHRRNINPATILSATCGNKERVAWYRETVAKVDTDPEKAKRIASQQCAFCYYASGRIGGAAMTSVQCGLCDKDLLFGNTCVDVLCPECAKTSSLCKHCGSDIDMKERRKRVLPVARPGNEEDKEHFGD